MNRTAIASRDSNLGQIARILARVLKVQVLFACIVLVLIVISSFGLVLLGEFSEVQVILVCIAISMVVINVPFSFGNRLLIGLDKTYLAVLLSAIAPPFTLASVVALSLASMPGGSLYLVWPVSNLLVGFFVCRVALSRIQLSIRALVRLMFSTRMRDKSDPILPTSAAMLAISIASPISYSSDRIVLASFVSTSAAAVYSVGGQVFGPILSILTTSATPLWSFNAANRGGESRGSVRDGSRLVVLSGVVGGALLLVAIPAYAWIVTGSSSFVSFPTQLAFSALVVANAVALPLMMSLNSGRDIQFQALIATLGCLVNLPISIVLARGIGVAGPLIASVLTMTLLQIIPMILWKRRAARRREADAKHSSDESNDE